MRLPLFLLRDDVFFPFFRLDPLWLPLRLFLLPECRDFDLEEDFFLDREEDFFLELFDFETDVDAAIAGMVSTLPAHNRQHNMRYMMCLNRMLLGINSVF